MVRILFMYRFSLEWPFRNDLLFSFSVFLLAVAGGDNTFRLQTVKVGWILSSNEIQVRSVEVLTLDTGDIMAREPSHHDKEGLVWGTL